MISNYIYQVSVPYALAEGVFDGQTTINELMSHGNFGLGTLNGLDGELIILNNQSFTIRDDGKAYPVTPNQTVPIVTITFFDSHKQLHFNNTIDYNQLKEIVDKDLPSLNLFYAIKITGNFLYMKCRSIKQQEKPYPEMKEIITKIEHFEHKHVFGTIVGFRYPAFTKGTGIPGYHFHFIDNELKFGGHVVNFELTNGIAEYSIKHHFVCKLDSTPEFYKAGLGNENEEIINNLE